MGRCTLLSRNSHLRGDTDARVTAGPKSPHLGVCPGPNFPLKGRIFEQGDDAVVVKSGINHEGRRRAMPSEEIVIRNCTINDGHAMLSIGSELSGGVKNVLMEDCHAEKTVDKVFFVKSNPERGGFVENVTVRRIKALDVKYEA